MGELATLWWPDGDGSIARRFAPRIRPVTGKRRIVAACAALLVLLAAPCATADEAESGSPGAFVATVGEQVIKALDSEDEDGRARRFRNILLGALDIDTIGQRALGRRWRQVGMADRARYRSLFRDYVVNLYANQLGGFAGERFTVLREQPDPGGESVVVAQVSSDGGMVLDVSFKLRRSDFGYKIVDVATSGMSLVVTKRAEFDSIIRREGVEGLLHRLDDKSSFAAIEAKRQRASVLAEVVTVLHAGRALLYQ